MLTPKKLSKKDGFPGSYLRNLEISNFKCFKEKAKINFFNNKLKPAKWNIIVGNNNSGKSTILQSVVKLAPVVINSPTESRRLLCVPYDLIQNTSNKNEIQEHPSQNALVKMDFFLFKNELASNIFSEAKFFTYMDELTQNNSKERRVSKSWEFTPNKSWASGDHKLLAGTSIFAYGMNRKISLKKKSEKRNNFETFFNEEQFLENVEDWLIQLDYSVKNKQNSASKIIDIITSVLKSNIFPDINGIEFVTSKKLENFIRYKTEFGSVRFKEMGYGYQTSISWVIDLIKNLIETYPESTNPLAEPAIVLIDEIDMHLHPSWQKNIVKEIDSLFPNIQFIVTTHSPLILQAIGSDLNLIKLRSNEKSVVIEQDSFEKYQGWSFEELMTGLLDVDGKLRSDRYVEMTGKFSKAILGNNKKSARTIYNELVAILHPSSIERKIIDMQLKSITGDK
jgi:predicted ATP-binding protein involved in virulence